MNWLWMSTCWAEGGARGGLHRPSSEHGGGPQCQDPAARAVTAGSLIPVFALPQWIFYGLQAKKSPHADRGARAVENHAAAAVSFATATRRENAA